MAIQDIPLEQVAETPPKSEGVKRVTEAEYLEHYADKRYEWVQGALIPMSPVTLTHHDLEDYLKELFKTYFTLNPIGRVVGDQIVMRVREVETARQPDLQIILNENASKITETGVQGAADLCIEIVSKESTTRDYGEKFTEYEAAGVREYWIIDPARKECRFFRLNADKLYTSQAVDDAGNYQTPLLPRFRLHVPTLWGSPLPNIIEVVDAVKIMLAD